MQTLKNGAFPHFLPGACVLWGTVAPAERVLFSSLSLSLSLHFTWAANERFEKTLHERVGKLQGELKSIKSGEGEI